MTEVLGGRTLPELKVHDHFKPVRQAKAKVSVIRAVHKMVETHNMSHNEAKKRVMLMPAMVTREPPAMMVTPTVKQSIMLQVSPSLPLAVSLRLPLSLHLYLLPPFPLFSPPLGLSLSLSLFLSLSR